MADQFKHWRSGAAILLIVASFVALAALFTSRGPVSDNSGPSRDSTGIEAAEGPAGGASHGVEPWRQVPEEQGGTVQQRSTPFESPFVSVAEALKRSVVNITVKKHSDLSQYHSFEDWLPFRDMPPQEVTSGGSGLIIDSQGRVVTNNHVVEGGEEILVRLSEGEERTASLIGVDPETDLALLDIGPVPDSMVAKLGDSDDIRIGDWAVAMGNPVGLDWTLTVGVISAVGRSDLLISGGGPVFQDFIQTDASINFGNSGGPLANIHGEVIGINAAVNTAAQGIGFAIPINMAREVMTQLLDSGVVRRGYLGMIPVELDELRREALELDESVQGIFVESVSNGTPADRGGLEGSDVITEVDGEPVSDVADFRLRIARHEPGSKLELTVLRDGRTRSLNFTLADRSEFVETAREGVSGGVEPWMGLSVAPLDDEEGVVVSTVDSDSPAEGKIAVGDVIVEIDGEEIGSIADWRDVTTQLRSVTRAVLVKFHQQGEDRSRFVALKR